MSLTLYFHPLSSFCQKVLIGLYELQVPFTPRIVDLSDAGQRAALLKLWPMGKFPVLVDEARQLVLPETSIILEYLDQQHGPGRLIPNAVDAARDCRLRDRFFDLHVNTPMQKIVTDKLRPAGAHDAHGVEEARQQLRAAYAIAEGWVARQTWAAGDDFGMADCAAAPALYYAKRVLPWSAEHAHLARYFERLSRRPSFVRVMEEASPYLAMFPG